ncbi:class I SAM-dependent methyltransferase [Streptomyces sp. NPDC058171]
MADQDFDAAALYDEDYLHFYAGPGIPADHERQVGDDRSEADADLIVRLLELRAGARVLDLACGHGRIASRLAARGHAVTGTDSSPAFLTRARADASARGVHVDYWQGDMRDLPWDGEFDAVVNWFTAYGYFDDDTNRAVLRGVARALRPGGRVILDLNNLTSALRGHRPARVAVHDDGDLFADRHHLDPLTSRLHAERTVVRGGRARTFSFHVRLFAFPELRDWLHAAGFTDVSGHGEDGGPLRADHDRMVVVARRA